MRERASILTPAAAFLLVIAVAFGGVSVASAHDADYTVLRNNWYKGHGSDGGRVVDHNTYLPTSNATSTWNSWMGVSKLTSSGSLSGCGSTVSCNVYFIVTSTRPTVNGATCQGNLWSSSSWATAHIDAGDSWQSADCGGTSSQPVFQIAVKAQSLNSNQQKHIARHELAHSLQLGDAGHACWQSGSTVYPLMNNGFGAACTWYGDNITATSGEAAKAKLWSGW